MILLNNLWKYLQKPSISGVFFTHIHPSQNSEYTGTHLCPGTDPLRFLLSCPLFYQYMYPSASCLSNTGKSWFTPLYFRCSIFLSDWVFAVWCSLQYDMFRMRICSFWSRWTSTWFWDVVPKWSKPCPWTDQPFTSLFGIWTYANRIRRVFWRGCNLWFWR